MTRKISRGVRAKPPRKPALLPSLLRALDARPDVTVLTRAWPVVFVVLRYLVEKTVVNPEGFSPLHRETPRFVGEAWEATTAGVCQIPTKEFAGFLAHPIEAMEAALGPIRPEVSARLGLSTPVERETAITGRSMER